MISTPTHSAETPAVSGPVAGAVLDAREVSLTFANGVRALEEVSLSISAGEFVSIVGPSGCGKSTFLRLVAGLLSPTRGSIQLQGLAPAEFRRKAHGVSFVFQQPTLLPWRSTEDNVKLPLELGGSARRLDPERIGSISGLLQLVGLQEFAKSRPHELSGGMQMRVALARALVTAPDLLLLDEPFAALDEITRMRLNEDLLSLWARDRWTALFVTHSVAEAVFLSRRVVVMGPRPGRILENFPVPFEYPRSPSLRAEPEFARLCGRISDQLRASLHA